MANTLSGPGRRRSGRSASPAGPVGAGDRGVRAAAPPVLPARLAADRRGDRRPSTSSDRRGGDTPAPARRRWRARAAAVAGPAVGPRARTHPRRTGRRPPPCWRSRSAELPARRSRELAGPMGTRGSGRSPSSGWPARHSAAGDPARRRRGHRRWMLRTFALTYAGVTLRLWPIVLIPLLGDDSLRAYSVHAVPVLGAQPRDRLNCCCGARDGVSERSRGLFLYNLRHSHSSDRFCGRRALSARRRAGRAVAAGHGCALDGSMIPTVLEEFWPSRRDAEFDELCSPAA